MRIALIAALGAVLAGCSYGYVQGGVPREVATSCVRGAGVTGQYALRIIRSGGAETYRVPPGQGVSETQSRQINACIAQAEPTALRVREGLFGQRSRCTSVFDRGAGYCINASTKSPALSAAGLLD